MLVYLDTDALSHLEAHLRDPIAIEGMVRSRGTSVVASEHLLEEVLGTTDHERRHRLAMSLLALIEHDGRVLAAVSDQLKAGWSAFRDGQSPFQPVAHFDDRVKNLLRDARGLSPDVIRDLSEKRRRDVAAWDSMHSRGRPHLQCALDNCAPPSPSEWIREMFDSEFSQDCVIQAIGATPEQRNRVSDYILWNPICRAWLELLLLEIRRQGLLMKNESSKWGPKWADVSHGAFAPVVDWFVTDDRRFRASLQEHKEARDDCPTWRVGSLKEFLTP